MLPYDEKDIRLLAEVLPNVSAQLRSSMVDLFAAANRIAQPEARAKDPVLDQNAAYLTMSCHQMLRLVSNLSAMSALMENASFSLRAGDIVSFCRTLCERAEPFYSLCGVTLRFSASCASRSISFDRSMLERALLNLLSNALKFTPRGGSVELRVVCTERSVRIIVSDTGRGIAPDRLERLFDRYLDTGRLDPYPHGLGVGLALCRRIAQGHGGLLTAESVEGKGSTFTLSLPGDAPRSFELREPRFDYAGGFDHVLMELSDALPYTAFLRDPQSKGSV